MQSQARQGVGMNDTKGVADGTSIERDANREALHAALADGIVQDNAGETVGAEEVFVWLGTRVR